MDDRNRYQTSHVADAIGVSVSTVRRLAARYAELLSDEATPRPGGRRSFCDEDVAILREANRLTAAGLSEDEIAQRLAQSVTLPAEAVTAPTTAAPQLPTLSFDTTSLEKAIERQADIQLAHVEALQLHAQAMDRLGDRLVWIVAALVVIALLAVAVAAGWL